MKEYNKHYKFFKRFLKENGVWAFIQSEIRKEIHTKENFFKRIECLEKQHQYHPWSLALMRTDVLSFSFVESQSEDFTDGQWYAKWVNLAKKYEQAQKLLYDKLLCNEKSNFNDILSFVIND